MRKFGAGKGKDSGVELNMTPTIDMVFLLLIFFIATMQWPETESNISAYLPRRDEAAGTTVLEEREEINEAEIHLNPGVGESIIILFNGRDVGGFSGLMSAMRLLNTNAPESRIILAVHRQVPYKNVVRTLDVCGRYGFEDVIFARTREEG